MQALAEELEVVYTRYADDIVFSGKSDMPNDLDASVKAIIVKDGWSISEGKFQVTKLPKRLKVHGLLVHGNEVRLTKGYRNKIRAFRHLIDNGKISKVDIPKLSGHIAYANFIDSLGVEVEGAHSEPISRWWSRFFQSLKNIESN